MLLEGSPFPTLLSTQALGREYEYVCGGDLGIGMVGEWIRLVQMGYRGANNEAQYAILHLRIVLGPNRGDWPNNMN